MALYTVFLVSPTILATVGSRKSSGQNDEARIGEWTSNQAATSGNITLETVSRARQAVEAAEWAARPRNSPQIPPGSVGGHGAGQRIPQSLREQYFLEGCPKPPCSYCRQNGDAAPNARASRCTAAYKRRCSGANSTKGARTAAEGESAGKVKNQRQSIWPQNGETSKRTKV